MSYTEIALLASALVIGCDLFLLKTRLIFRAGFWCSYAIILPFQLLTNWWLTSRQIVMYDPTQIIGLRIAHAPFEDLLFGFALILSVLSFWIYAGRRLSV